MSNLIPEPWREALERVSDKVDHFLTRLASWKKHEHSPEKINAETLPDFMQRGGPLLDMHETPDDLIIRAEVPGLQKDDFSVEFIGKRLIIKGEKKVLRKQKGGDGCLIAECRYGSFRRTLQIPYVIDEKNVSANLKDGVLTIRLPKSEQERSGSYRVPVS